MDWLQLFFLHPVYLYQGAAFPFALLFNYLCTMDSFSIQARYLFLLAGGGALALAAMGSYALLVFIPALCAVALVSFLGPQEVHRLTFFFQMSWQTLCHLGLHYTEYYLQEAPSPRHSFWALTRKGLQILGLECVKVALRGLVSAGAGLEDCQQLECISVMWSTAGLFKLTYYSHWILDDSLLYAAGFGSEFGQSPSEEGYIQDADIWTLETTHRIALFTRKWNQSTARWLRRLIFQQSRGWPLLQTFAFSAWWHGLHPGQVFGFLCWAVMVEADYLIHTFANVFIRSWPTRLLYRALTWAHTQLIIAYVMLAVEVRSLSSLWLLCNSYSSVFPMVYCILFFLLVRRKHKFN